MPVWIAKAGTPFVIAVALLLAAVLAIGGIVVRIDTMLDDAAATAIAARDAHWTAEIERASAVANRQIADQAKAALVIETAANARVREAETQLAEMETKNAALPGGDAVGLGRDRVRVLPR